MTIPVAPVRKVDYSLSRFSTGRGSACSNILIFDQFAQESSAFKADRHSPARELEPSQAVAPLSRPPAASSAAFKSP